MQWCTKNLLNLVVLSLMLFSIRAYAAPQNDQLKRAERLLASMTNSLNKVALEIRKATEKSDVSLVNCLKQKERSMKNYFDASLRNHENLRSAWKVKDSREAGRFLWLLEIAHKKVKEIEDSLKDCMKGEYGEPATRVMVIKPEGIDEDLLEELYPGIEGEPQDPRGFPPVEPASPFQ